MNENSSIRITSVKPLGSYLLEVGFARGKTMATNLAELVFRLKGLKSLRDPQIFSRAEVGEDGFSVTWPGGLDLGADRLFGLALEQNGRAEAAEFIRWRWRNALSLTAAAEALGLSRRQVAYYASGEHEIPRYIFLALRGWEQTKNDKRTVA